MFDKKNILVTGGTGSFGKQFVATLLKRYCPAKIVIFSRDELKQYEMSQDEFFSNYQREDRDVLRFFIGDVRDLQRLEKAMEGIDIVVHTAALKQVPATEYNPFEAVKTNIIGAQNVIDAAMGAGVKKVIALSTDKAAAPVNLYGATKLASDKLFVAANNHRGWKDIKFSVVRYGNVLGSRGSVVPLFLKLRPTGRLPVTDQRMTRFSITLQEGVDFVIDCLERMWGGEVFIPKIPSYRIIDVAKAVAPECEVSVVGIRPGEKLHEEMITETDALNTVEFKDYYVILPSMRLWDVESFICTSSASNGQRVEYGFRYNSNENHEFLTVDAIRLLVEAE